jgi:DNA-binding response OmpR family regulator
MTDGGEICSDYLSVCRGFDCLPCNLSLAMLLKFSGKFVEKQPTMQTILVCDDDELLVELLSHRFASRGFQVLVASDGGAAVELANKHQPDAIVLDMMMPVLDGQQVLRRLRSEGATASIPVVMLTARRQERDIVSALKLGADDYLVKPFIPEELMSRLTRLMATSR